MARPDGYVTYYNSYWRQLTGLTNEQSLGDGGFAALHPDDREPIREQWNRHMQSTDDWETELRLYEAASKQYVWHLARARPVLDEQGRVQHWIGTAVNIDRLKRAEAQLQQLNEELELRVADRTAALETANRELESFSYSVSHDLRAPLRAIDGFSRILAEDHAAELSPEARRLLGVVCENVRRMGALIDDLLAYSRLSRQPVRRQTIDMNELLTSIVAEQRAGWGERSVEVKFGRLPACVGDAALLRQVWTNLLANAVKFTRKSQGAVIEIGSRIEPTRPGSYTYWIRDNGVGFDMKYAGKLFGVFQRLHPQTEFEGTGVGLAIVESIVRRHGGQVRAEGKIGEGATFFVSLPAND
jgi:PAS domain S-box-containing protein